jgi:hypothetical protein
MPNVRTRAIAAGYANRTARTRQIEAFAPFKAAKAMAETTTRAITAVVTSEDTTASRLVAK